MLSLGRKEDEYIMIGDDIKIKIIKSEGTVRIGIEAPSDLPIVRGELYEDQQRISAKAQKQSVTR